MRTRFTSLLVILAGVLILSGPVAATGPAAAAPVPAGPLTLDEAARLALGLGPVRSELDFSARRAEAGKDLAQSAFNWHLNVGTARIPQLVELAQDFGAALGDLKNQVGQLSLPQSQRQPVVPTIVSSGLTGVVYDEATGHRWAVLPALSAAKTFPGGGQLMLATHWTAFGPVNDDSRLEEAKTQWQPFQKAPLLQFTQPLRRDPATLEPVLRRDEAQRNVTRDRLAASLTETKTLLDLAQAYFAVAQAGDEVEAAGRALGQAQTEARVRQDKAWKDDATGLDLQEAEVMVQRAAARVEAARHALEVSRQRLNRMLGRPLSTPVILAPPADPPAAAPTGGAPATATGVGVEDGLEAAIAEALTHRAEVALARSGVESARAQLAAARQGSRTQVAASAAVAQDKSWSVGLDVQVPLYDGGRGAAQVAQAEAALALAEKAETDREDDLRLQVTQAYYARQDAARSFQVTDLTVDRARRAASLARERLAKGSVASREVTVAEDALCEAETNRRAALYRWHQAEWAWLAARGRLPESVRR